MHSRNNACPRMLQYKPPRIAFMLLAAAAALQLAGPAAWYSLPASIGAGCAIVLLGFGIMTRAWWLFRISGTAICPTAATTTLLTDDIYRLTRNPMYLGIVMMLLGTAVATGGLFFYIAALLFFLIIDFAFCPYEEAKLEQGFGSSFLAYRQRVRRWL
jgi:protein-S-isoprenylcysteine O-methyltransferase Ste14